MKVPVIARVIRLSIVRYCSVITTIAAAAAIEATAEVINAAGTTGRQMIELSIPAIAPATLASLDLQDVGVPEPAVDED